MFRKKFEIKYVFLLAILAGLGLAQSFHVPMDCYLDTGAVDIVFCMDTSRSMEPYIEDLQDNIVEFIDSIIAHGYDFRLGAVPFDDSTNVWDFDPGTPGNQMTADTVQFNSWLADLDVSLVASDSWEVSLDAIFDALVDYESAQQNSIPFLGRVRPQDANPFPTEVEIVTDLCPLTN